MAERDKNERKSCESNKQNVNIDLGRCHMMQSQSTSFAHKFAPESRGDRATGRTNVISAIFLFCFAADKLCLPQSNNTLAIMMFFSRPSFERTAAELFAGWIRKVARNARSKGVEAMRIAMDKSKRQIRGVDRHWQQNRRREIGGATSCGGSGGPGGSETLMLLGKPIMECHTIAEVQSAT